MTEKRVKINRAPVMTLWAAVVAERFGYDHETALTLGKAVAGLNAQSKGKRLGIFSEAKQRPEEYEQKARKPGENSLVTVLGRPVPVMRTTEGIRATAKGDPVDPQSVQRYLTQKFGEDLANVQAAMEALARAFSPEKLAGRAYTLYEEFRPAIPEGQRGWGAKGELDLSHIRALGKEGG